MTSDTRTPNEILQAAKAAQAQADQVREADIVKTLEKMNTDRDITRRGYSELEGIKGGRKELATIIEGEKEGKDVVHEVTKAEANLAQSEADVSGVIREAESANVSAMERPEISSRLYDEAKTENDRRQREKEYEERVKTLALELNKLMTEYKSLEVTMIQKNEEIGQARQQFMADRQKKALELGKLAEVLLIKGMPDQAESRIRTLTAVDGSNYYIKDRIEADNILNSSKSVTSSLKAFGEAREKVSFFEFKIKKYLKEISEWLKKYWQDAQPKYKAHNTAEADYFQFVDDSAKRKSGIIQEIKAKADANRMLYNQASGSIPNFEEFFRLATRFDR